MSESQLSLFQEFVPEVKRAIGMCTTEYTDKMILASANRSLSFVGPVSPRGNILHLHMLRFQIKLEFVRSFIVEAENSGVAAKGAEENEDVVVSLNIAVRRARRHGLKVAVSMPTHDQEILVSFARSDREAGGEIRMQRIIEDIGLDT